MNAAGVEKKRVTDKSALIEANAAFYTAFAEGNADLMEGLWSGHAEITCIHPGWPPLDGLDEVMGSWRCILSASSPLIGISDAKAYQYENVGYVVCQEHLEPGVLVATNIFFLEEGNWKLVHHQAGISPSNVSHSNTQGTDTLQ